MAMNSNDPKAVNVNFTTLMKVTEKDYYNI